MGLRKRLKELTSIEEVDQFLEKYSTCAFFKAGACHKTMQGFGYVEESLDKREDIPMAFVRVIENRPVSNYIEEITGIVHQSPQFILIKEKKVVFDVDNWDIVPEVLESALSAHFGDIEKSEKPELSTNLDVTHANVAPYIELLQQYVTGLIDELTFRDQWLKMFQMDASLRSTQEFGLLNSLFGDVDRAIEEGDLVSNSGSLKMACSTKPPTNTLKSKAAKLLNDLKE